MDEPRAIPIRQSPHRPELVMGGEREPVMCAALMAIITGIVGAVQAAFVTVFIALAFYFGTVFLFRRMAKADPIMTKVWRRHISYRGFYRARSQFWAKDGYRR